jgi:hypothetical protein
MRRNGALIVPTVLDGLTQTLLLRRAIRFSEDARLLAFNTAAVTSQLPCSRSIRSTGESHALDVRAGG